MIIDEEVYREDKFKLRWGETVSRRITAVSAPGPSRSKDQAYKIRTARRSLKEVVNNSYLVVFGLQNNVCVLPGKAFDTDIQ